MRLGARLALALLLGTAPLVACEQSGEAPAGGISPEDSDLLNNAAAMVDEPGNQIDGNAAAR